VKNRPRLRRITPPSSRPVQPSAATLTEYAAALEWAVHLERQRILEAVLALPGIKLVERDAVVRVIT